MRPDAFLSAPEFAYKARYEAMLKEVLEQMGVDGSQVLWTFTQSNHTVIAGVLTLSGKAGIQYLPSLSVYLDLAEVRIMYTFWLSTILRARLNYNGASHIRGLESRLTFGEHMGATIKEVIEVAPRYLEWAQDDVENFELDSEASDALEDALGQTDDLEGLF